MAATFRVLQVEIYIGDSPLPERAFAVTADAEDWEPTRTVPGLVTTGRRLPPKMLRFAVPEQRVPVMLPYNNDATMHLILYRSMVPYDPEQDDAFDTTTATVIWSKQIPFVLSPERFPLPPTVPRRAVGTVEEPVFHGPMNAICFNATDDSISVVLHIMKATQRDNKTPLTAAGNRQWALIGMIALIDAALYKKLL